MKTKTIVTTLAVTFAVILSHRAEAVVTITANGTVTAKNSSALLNIGDSISIQFIANSGIGAANYADSFSAQDWLYGTASQPALWDSVTSPTLEGLFSNSFPGDQMYSLVSRNPSLGDFGIMTVRAASDTSGFDIGLTYDGDPVGGVDLTFRFSDVALITNAYFTGQTLDQTFKNGTFVLTSGFSGGDVTLDGGLGYEFDIDSVTITTAVPEPSSLGLLALGLCGVFARRRR